MTHHSSFIYTVQQCNSTVNFTSLFDTNIFCICIAYCKLDSSQFSATTVDILTHDYVSLMWIFTNYFLLSLVNRREIFLFMCNLNI